MQKARPAASAGVGSVAQGRRSRHRLPGTLAIRWCAGCGRLLGLRLWRRLEHRVVHTHGLCDACLEKATLELEEFDRSSASGSLGERRP